MLKHYLAHAWALVNLILAEKDILIINVFKQAYVHTSLCS